MSGVGRLVDMVRADCRRFGMRLRLAPHKWVMHQGAPCGGYCDPKSIVVATKGASWWMVLAHEYGHLRQWAEGSPFERRVEVGFFQWVNGEIRWSSARVQRAALAQLDCELDCERRTLRLAEQLGLRCDPAAYAREANAYLLYYAALPHLRAWYTAEPHEARSIVSRMPARLMPRRWYLQEHLWYREAISRRCIKEAA